MRFLDELDIRKCGEREWMLLSDFRFESAKYPGIFVAPEGMVTNFASIPRIVWRVLPPIGNYDEAAVIHDAGCNGKLLTPSGFKIHTVKHVIDNIFYEALTSPTLRRSAVGPKTAKLMYLIIKKFGKYGLDETGGLSV